MTNNLFERREDIVYNTVGLLDNLSTLVSVAVRWQVGREYDKH